MNKTHPRVSSIKLEPTSWAAEVAAQRPSFTVSEPGVGLVPVVELLLAIAEGEGVGQARFLTDPVALGIAVRVDVVGGPAEIGLVPLSAPGQEIPHRIGLLVPVECHHPEITDESVGVRGVDFSWTYCDALLNSYLAARV